MRPSNAALAVFTVCTLTVAMTVGAEDEPKTNGYRIFGQLTSLFEQNRTGPDRTQPQRLEYSKFKQLASFNIEWKRITVGVQAEYLDWSVPEENRDRLDLDRLRSGFELRRYFVDYRSDRFSGRLGTFFSSFGRGMTLFVQKNETLQLDEPIHGATARLNLKNLELSALWGTVTEPVQQAQYGREFEDEVMGGRLRLKLPWDLYLGGSASRAELDRFFPAGVDIVEVWSAEAGATGLWGVLDLAAELAEISKEGATRTRDGHGRYLSASLYAGPLSVLAEYKDYYNFAYRYNLPPNAGRANESYEHNDVKGPRLLVSADFWETGTLVHASYAEFDSHTSRGSAPDSQREWYAGIEQTIGRVYFEGSYFDRRHFDRKAAETHTLADLHVTIGQRGEIILGYDRRLEEFEAPVAAFETTRTNLTYSHSPWGTASLRYSYEDRLSPAEDGRDEFWGVELQYLPRPTIVLTVFGGGDPGGLICAGGQCRQEPRFEGYRANVTWRF